MRLILKSILIDIPVLLQVTREVAKRTDDLTHQVHRETLSRSTEQVKTLAPILICSMKIFIQIIQQGKEGMMDIHVNSQVSEAGGVRISEHDVASRLAGEKDEKWATILSKVARRDETKEEGGEKNKG